MKFALAFLFGFALVTCQPYMYKLNPKFFNPLLYNWAKELNSPSPYYVQSPQYRVIFFNPYGSLVGRGAEERGEDEPRYVNTSKNKTTAAESDRDFITEPRFFLNFGNTGSNAPPKGQLLFRTVIATTVITTTVPSISKCIPATEFSVAAPLPCARRKRQIVEMLDNLNLAGNNDQEALAPSSVEKLETTEIAKDISPHEFQSSDLLSSKEEDAEMQKRSKRFLLAVTTTITSYFFVNSTVVKTVNLIRSDAVCIAASTKSCLVCIPEGYGVCA